MQEAWRVEKENLLKFDFDHDFLKTAPIWKFVFDRDFFFRFTYLEDKKNVIFPS